MFLEFHNPCFLFLQPGGSGNFQTSARIHGGHLCPAGLTYRLGRLVGWIIDDDDDDDAFMHANCVVLLDWIVGLEARLTKDSGQHFFLDCICPNNVWMNASRNPKTLHLVGEKRDPW